MIVDFGLELFWDGDDRIEVLLPAYDSFKEQTCGICGNWNNNKTDDWIIGKQCEESAGQEVSIVNAK